MPTSTLRRPASPSGGRRRFVRLAAIIPTVAAVTAFATLTESGATAASKIHTLLEYYSGVFSLVTLSITVMSGLAATERILPGSQRVRLQIAHRALAFTAVAFLGVHVLMKLIETHANALDVVIPFRASHRVIPVGLGTIAAYLMVAALWAGVVRARFAGSSRPWLWRTIHSTAYLAWPFAVAHGLAAGRAARPWVVVSYVLCFILVAVLLVIRLAGSVTQPAPGMHARTAAIVTTSPEFRSEVTAVEVAEATAEPASPAVLGAEGRSAEQPPGRGPGVADTSLPATSPRTPRTRVRTDRAERVLASVPASDASSPDGLPDEQFWAFIREEHVR